MKFESYIGVFRNPTYVRLFLAQFTSQLGSVTGLIAFTFFILDRFSTQPFYATVTEMMYSLPTLFIFFLTGVLADTFDRQKITQNCNYITAFLSLLLLGAVILDILPLVFALLFIRSAVTKFFAPAQSALLQGILSKEDYPVAIGLNQMLTSIFLMTGSGLGAVVYWTVGIEGAIVIDIIGFIIAGLLITSCKIPEQVRLPNGKVSLRNFQFSTVIHNFAEGVKYSRNQPIVEALLFGILIIGILNGGQSVMHIFNAKYRIAPETYEQIQVLLTAFLTSGVLVGSFVSTYLTKKMDLHKMIIISFFLAGVVVLTQSFTYKIWIYLLLQFLQGLSIPICNVAFFGWLGKIVDPKMMGRVQGLITPLMMLSITITQGFIAVTFPKVLSVDWIFYIVGFASLATAIYYSIRLPYIIKRENDVTRTTISTEIVP